MQLNKGLFAALTVVLTLAAGDALAQPAGSDSGSPGGETGGDPGDFSSAWFISPLPNASFDVAPATLDAEIGVYQGADDESISTIDVFVDDVSIGAQDCPAGCTFADIELGQGVHELRLLADSGYTTATLVYVDEELPGGTGDTGGTTTGDTTGDTTGGSEGGGGGCSANGEPSSPWGLLAVPVLVLGALFRRKR